MNCADPFTSACPLYSRARSLGGRTGEAFTVEPAKADRTIEIICGVCLVFTALFAFGGGFG